MSALRPCRVTGSLLVTENFSSIIFFVRQKFIKLNNFIFDIYSNCRDT